MLYGALRILGRAAVAAGVRALLKRSRGTPGRLCPLHMSDGPILLDALRERIIRRVIGLYQHPGIGNF